MAAKPISWWQKYGNAAQIASAIIAICGFIAVLLQVNELRLNGRAMSARQTYLRYMDMAFRNPSFADADYEKIKAAGKDEEVRYDTFVSYFLYACEEAMVSLETKNEWHEACELELKPHLPFLCERLKTEPGYLATFNPMTRDVVKAAMARYGVVPPECKVRKT
jgi:hypothetical protein